MNIFRKLAETDRPKFNEARRTLQEENSKLSRELTELSPETIAASAAPGGKPPIRAWQSRDFLVRLFIDEVGEDKAEFARLSINRTELDNDGNWQDGIAWDTLMRIKREVGFGECWLTEVFPADSETVNDENVRHLFITAQPPFVWVKSQNEEGA